MATKIYSTADEIGARLTALATAHPTICTVSDIGTTGGGRPIKCLRIKGSSKPKASVIVVTGQHPDELAAPEALLDFVEQVLAANGGDTAVVYPAMTVTGTAASLSLPPAVLSNGDAKKWIERLDLHLVALANPDGRVHVQADGVSPWRKNVSAVAPCTKPTPTPPPAGGWGAGVNLNRNFDIAWDLHFYGSAWLAPTTTSPFGQLITSDEPCDNNFRGPSAASEPETQALQTLVDTVRPNYFLDLHGSAGVEIRYPWALAGTQTTDPTQSFTRRDLDRVDGDPTRPGRALDYKEYMLPGLQKHLIHLAEAVKTKITRGLGDAGATLGGVTVAPIGEGGSYSPGTAVDYAFSRHFVDGTRSVTYALNLECGFEDFGKWAPTDTNQYSLASRCFAFTVAAMLDDASNNCVIVTAALGSRLAPGIDEMRRLRDEVVRPTRIGAALLARVEPWYDRAGAPIARYLDGNERARRVARVLFTPLVRAAQAAFRLTSSAGAAPRTSRFR